MWEAVIGAVGGVLGGGVGVALVAGWFGRRKAAAEAEVTLSDALTDGYSELVQELRAERAELREERAEMRKELRQAHADNQALRLEIGELRSELRAVKTDINRVTAGLPPLTDWSNRP